MEVYAYLDVAAVPVIVYKEGAYMSNEIGERLVEALKNPEGPECQESFARAMELTKAYASSGSATHFSAVARLFYDLFEMFETGNDPRQK
jgi:hypothetical protein